VSRTRALVFDFDGLIVDTELPEYESWQDVYREYGADLPLSEWVACIGTTFDAFDPVGYLEAAIGRKLDREAVFARHRVFDEERVADQPPMPGVVDCIASARSMGLGLAVASSSSHRGVDGHLERIGLLDVFDHVVCRDDVDRVKPAPDLYLTAVERLGARPDEAVAFEDSTNGILSACEAGLKVVAVPNAMTASLDFGMADIVVSSLAEMPLKYLLASI
jgi:HAD superfamily hydrolase (TIGR01509 family)